MLMLDRTVSHSTIRRRFLVGLALAGLSPMVAGCERALALMSAARPDAQSKRMNPAPLPPANPPVVPAVLVGVTFGRMLRLDGVTIEQETVTAGEYLRLWLHWQTTGPATEDWRSIGRLVTPAGRVLAGEDDQIGGRRRHLTRWQAGDHCVDEMRVLVTAGVPAGEYLLAVGVLRPDNQTSVPVTSRPYSPPDGQEDSVLVGMIEVIGGQDAAESSG